MQQQSKAKRSKPATKDRGEAAALDANEEEEEEASAGKRQNL
jgi:hypothetical protein